MEFTSENLASLFAQLAARMAQERDALCVLDGLIGDADHGIAMQQGMAAAALAASPTPNGRLQDQFNAAASAFLNAVGASSGPLYATALLRAGRAAGASMTRAQGPTLIVAMAEGIAHRGKAVVGQKTMMDAWAPAAQAATSGADWPQIVAAAHRGADATADMIATLGRAERLGARSLGHKDPGAVSAVMIIEEIARAFTA